MNYLRVTSGMKHISLSDFPRTNTGMPYNLRYYVFVITFDLDIWDILWSQAFFFFPQHFVQQTFNKHFWSSFYLSNTVVGAGNS